MTVFYVSATTSSGITLNSGDTMSVGGFGIASATIVKSGGEIDVLSRGSAGGTVVDGGIASINLNGRATSTYITNGGTQFNLGKVTGTVVGNGGTELANGTDVDTTISSGGAQFVAGSAVSTVIDSGGQQTVYQGAHAVETIISSGGFDIVSGGSLGVATVLDGGTLIATPGSIASHITVSNGGTFIHNGVWIGTPTSTQVAGPTITDETVSSGASEYVLAHATASRSIVNGDAMVWGSAVDTVVNGGGLQLIQSGGTATGTVLSGGSEDVLALGGTSASVVESGGVQIVDGSGSAVATVVSNGGIEFLEGGLSISTTVESGGLEAVQAGEALRTTVASGGTLEVGPSPVGTYSASLTTVQSGGVMVVSKGNVNNTTVDSGGTLIVFPLGNQVTNTHAAAGALVISAGVVIIQPGSGLVAHGDPTLAGGIVGSGGLEFVFKGGTATDATIASGGSAAVLGAFDAGTIGSGGVMGISAGTATDVTISAGGSAVVAFGSMTGTVIDGGQLTINAGIVTNTTINSGGVLDVAAFGFHISAVASGVVVNDAGTLTVQDGILAGATINSGGTLDLSAGAVTSAVFHGGRELIGANAANTQDDVSANGMAELDIGFRGLARNTVIGSGGVETVMPFGSATNTTIATSGALYLYSGAVVSSGVTFSGTDAALVVHNSAIVGATISGFATTDTIDFADITATNSGAATLDPATDTLVVYEGGTSITLQFAGDYTGEFFRFGSDGASGTLITVDGTPCYCRGTLIQTDHGAVPVETLQIGDLLVTKSGEARPIRWIGTRHYSAVFAEANRAVLPIQFKAGSLEDGIPRRDLFVSPEHAMFLDGVLVPALALVNGVSVLQPPVAGDVAYFHLELETHDVILAEGALSESFIDDDSRGMFHNAAEYRALYPAAAVTPARFCAPRIESGDHLAAIHGAIAARAGLAAGQGGQLLGMVDLVGLGRIEGWAVTEAQPNTPVDLRVTDNGVTIGQIRADRPRLDLAAAGVGDGRHGFVFAVPGGLAPDRPHVIRVQRASDGLDLPGSPYHLQPQAAPTAPAPIAERPALRACLEIATRDRVAGWAWDPARPNDPVALQILDNGEIIGRVLANAHRADLAAAGIGDGRHAFDWRFPAALSLYARHVLSVRLEDDGSEAENAPAVIDPATGFDSALEQAVAQAIAAIDGLGEQERVLSFLAAQAERLLQLRADAEGQRQARLTQKQRRRWDPAPAATPASTLRALVVDDLTPNADRDAGSLALLSHMLAMQGLGYAVSFAAAQGVPPESRDAAVLERQGITVYRAPYYASVEEVLRRQAHCFDVIYLHRVATASAYFSLARQHHPRARIVYSVADLHHVRVARQAALEQRPELMAESRRLRLLECTAAWSADAVITHSTTEAELLRHAVPGANVHVVPWAMPVQPTTMPLAARRGVAFIGGFAHTPNCDAARYLAETIMPLVWQTHPEIEALLAGSAMPGAIAALARPGIAVLGAVPNLSDVFDRVRLTVAPLRYGAGVKGKVLSSFAAGIPCVMTPTAAEGIALPQPLDHLVATDAAAFAAIIIQLHAGQTPYRAASAAGLSLIETGFNAARVSEALGAAIEGRGQAMQLAATG